MTLALAILGYAMVVVLLLCVLVALICAVLGAWERLQTKHDSVVKELDRRAGGDLLQTAAWWFSDDVPTMELLQDIATEMQRGGHPGSAVSDIRERWRTARSLSANAPMASCRSGIGYGGGANL